MAFNGRDLKRDGLVTHQDTPTPYSSSIKVSAVLVKSPYHGWSRHFCNKQRLELKCDVNFNLNFNYFRQRGYVISGVVYMLIWTDLAKIFRKA